jgi:hypothetical protein
VKSTLCARRPATQCLHRSKRGSRQHQNHSPLRAQAPSAAAAPTRSGRQKAYDQRAETKANIERAARAQSSAAQAWSDWSTHTVCPWQCYAKCSWLSACFGTGHSGPWLSACFGTGQNGPQTPRVVHNSPVCLALWRVRMMPTKYARPTTRAQTLMRMFCAAQTFNTAQTLST